MADKVLRWASAWAPRLTESPTEELAERGDGTGATAWAAVGSGTVVVVFLGTPVSTAVGGSALSTCVDRMAPSTAVDGIAAGRIWAVKPPRLTAAAELLDEVGPAAGRAGAVDAAEELEELDALSTSVDSLSDVCGRGTRTGGARELLDAG